MPRIAAWNLPGSDIVQVTYLDLVGDFRRTEPDAENVVMLNSDELPGDIESPWRLAWRIQDLRVVMDMPTARDLHRDRLREDRVVELRAADHEIFRLMDNGGKRSDIAAARRRRQALRDVPADPRIEGASTVEELEKLDLSVLAGP